MQKIKKVPWFKVVEWLSACRETGLQMLLKVVIVSADGIEFVSSFYQRGSVRVKVLENDLVPHIVKAQQGSTHSVTVQLEGAYTYRIVLR